MSDTPSKRRGRPPNSPYGAKQHRLNFRADDRTLYALQQSAVNNNHSLSRDIELRVQMSFQILSTEKWPSLQEVLAELPVTASPEDQGTSPPSEPSGTTPPTTPSGTTPPSAPAAAPSSGPGQLDLAATLALIATQGERQPSEISSLLQEQVAELKAEPFGLFGTTMAQIASQLPQQQIAELKAESLGTLALIGLQWQDRRIAALDAELCAMRDELRSMRGEGEIPIHEAHRPTLAEPPQRGLKPRED
jgi:hypothetical protein